MLKIHGMDSSRSTDATSRSTLGHGTVKSCVYGPSQLPNRVMHATCEDAPRPRCFHLHADRIRKLIHHIRQ
jgi:hypothetical protein